MSASRTWMGLRSASNSHHANNLATMAKKAGSDVVDTLVNNHTKRQRTDELSSIYLAQAAVLSSSDFGTDMGDFAPGGFLSDLDLEDDDLSLCENNDFLSAPASPSVPSASASTLRTHSHRKMPSFSLSNNNPLADVFSPGVEFELDKLDRSADPFLDFNFSASSPPASPNGSDTSPKTVFATAPSSAMKNVFSVKTKNRTQHNKTSASRNRNTAAAMRESAPFHLSAFSSLQTAADKEAEAEFEKRIAAANARGDTAAIRQIKNGREKVRRAKMCNKFEELHDVVTITNQMMALSTSSKSEVVTANAAAAARNASAAASAAAAAKTAVVAQAAVAGTKKTKAAHLDKRKAFKKAEVLHSAIETIKEMQAQIELLAQRNARLEMAASSSGASAVAPM